MAKGSGGGGGKGGSGGVGGRSSRTSVTGDKAQAKAIRQTLQNERRNAGKRERRAAQPRVRRDDIGGLFE